MLGWLISTREDWPYYRYGNRYSKCVGHPINAAENDLMLRSVVLYLAWSLSALAAPSLVQITSAVNGNAASLSSSAITVTASHMLLVFAVGAGTNLATYNLSISDTLGNTWTQAVTGGYEAQQFEGHLWAWYSPNIAIGGSDTVTISYPSGTNFLQIHVLEVSGIAASSPLDTSGTGSVASSSSTTVSTAASVSQSSEYVVGFFNDWSNYPAWTAGTGYTIKNTYTAGSTNAESIVEELTAKTGLSGVQTATATLNYSDLTQGMILTFKAASAAVAVKPPSVLIF